MILPMSYNLLITGRGHKINMDKIWVIAKSSSIIIKDNHQSIY